MKICNSLLLISLLSIQSIAYADDIQHVSSVKENTGLSIGALIGGLLAGPPGAIVGAVGGSWFGTHETNTDNKITTLEKQLNAKSLELAYQQNELAITKEQFKNEFMHVVNNQEIQSLEDLSKGISYVIYYKTNSTEIRHDVRPQIQQLVELIKPYPEIQIQIEGHADFRGTENCNMVLSKERISKVRSEFINSGISSQRLHTHAYGEGQTKAQQGDSEAYIFDRRVIINLTLDREA